jgi:transcriptional regulator with XRE-family HTH domain
MAATKIQSPREVWPLRLREARLSAGLSQRELGKAAGIDPSVASTRINRYEVGVHSADYLIAVQLADVLNVPAAYLYAQDDEIAAVLVALHRAHAAKRRHLIKLVLDQS